MPWHSPFKMKNNTYISTLHDFSHEIYFYCLKKLKKQVFSFKIGLSTAPATYGVIYGSHSNWPSLNLSQNLREEWANSYWKRQALLFYPLGKKTQKNLMKGASMPPPPPAPPPFYVRGLILSGLLSFWFVCLFVCFLVEEYNYFLDSEFLCTFRW